MTHKIICYKGITYKSCKLLYYLVFILFLVIDVRQLAPDMGFFSCPHLCIPKFFTMCIAGRTAAPTKYNYFILK